MQELGWFLLSLVFLGQIPIHILLYFVVLIMTTIRRTIVILILLAICFFIYRGINPQGADRLLVQVRTLPDTFLWSWNILSRISSQTETITPVQTGTKLVEKKQSWTLKTWSVVAGVFASPAYLSGFLAWLTLAETVPSWDVFSWTDASWTGSLEDILFPSTEGKLTIVQPSSQQIPTWISLPPSSWSLPSSSVSTVSVTPNKIAPTVVKAAPVVKKSSSSQLSQQELRETQNLLNHLFR